MPGDIERPTETRSDDLCVSGLYVRAVRDNDRTVEFVASTEAIDSYDEIVEQTWRLERFNKNPVILWGHNSREMPIGRAHDGSTRVVGGALETAIQFAGEDVNPLAERVYRGIKQRFINAVSVGFMPGDVRREKRDGRDIYVLSDNELVEISVVSIPANPEALAKIRARARNVAGTGRAEGSTSVRVQVPTTVGTVSAFSAIEAALRQQGQQLVITPGPGLTLALPADSAPLFKINGPATPEQAVQLSALPTTDHPPAVERGGDVNQPPTGAQDMDIETLKKDNAALTTKAADAEKRAADAETRLATLTKENETLVKQTEALAQERDAFKAKADAADAAAIDAEVESYVGKKISAAEKPDYVELRKNSPELFKRIIAQRSDMDLTKSVIPAGPNGAPPAAPNNPNPPAARGAKDDLSDLAGETAKMFTLGDAG